MIRSYRRQNIGARRWRGSQKTLWRAFNPGSERSAALGEFRNPTTTERFAKFVPLLASKLGNNTGVPLGMNLTSPGLRDVVLLDLLNAPDAGEPGEPGDLRLAGPRQVAIAKNADPGRGWRWARACICSIRAEPREHERALGRFRRQDRHRHGQPRHFSLDALRIFPYAAAAENDRRSFAAATGIFGASRPGRAAGALSWPPRSRDAQRHRQPRAADRVSAGPARRRRDRADDDLLVGLEGLRTESLLRALFDETLPVADLAGAAAVIWNIAGLELPTVTEEYVAHLHDQTTPGQRAAPGDLRAWPPIWRSRSSSPAPSSPTCWWWRSAPPGPIRPAGRKLPTRSSARAAKPGPGSCGISQHPIKDFAVLEDEFIDQRLCLAFKDSEHGRATLEWCDRDLDRHPELLRNYVENTSPVQLVDHGDDAIDTRYGKVIPGREGEAWFLDEFGGFGKVGLFEAPTAELAAASTPTRTATGAHHRRAHDRAAALLVSDPPAVGPPGAAARRSAGAVDRGGVRRAAASASTNAMVLNWTGLQDSYGVPIGNYYLAIAVGARPDHPGRAGGGLESGDLDAVDAARPGGDGHQLHRGQHPHRRGGAVHRHRSRWRCG